ncbi:MAG: FG-GAP repeat protein [Nanoarchaeota archaeon]
MSYQKIINCVLIGLSGISLIGCNDDSSQKEQPKVESKLEYFLDKGVIGNPKADWGDSGVGVSLSDLDNDGDLDIIVATPWSMKYFENKLPQKNHYKPF